MKFENQINAILSLVPDLRVSMSAFIIYPMYLFLVSQIGCMRRSRPQK